jgi:hypothetical protein
MKGRSGAICLVALGVQSISPAFRNPDRNASGASAL